MEYSVLLLMVFLHFEVQGYFELPEIVTLISEETE